MSISRTCSIVLVALAACGNGGDVRRSTLDGAREGEPASAAAARARDGGADSATARPSGRTIWSGTSGGYRIEWTAEDIAVTRDPAAGGRDGASEDSRFSVREALDAVRGDVELIAADDSAGSICDDESGLRILSAVGPIMSVEWRHELYCRDAAHPSLHTSYAAIDLARTIAGGNVPEHGTGAIGREALLTDIFPDEEVLAALLEDRLVQRRIEELRGKVVRPKTTAELVTLLEGSAECEYAFESDMLRRFAFHHVEGDRVAVRIGLSHGCGAAQGRLTQIGILLKIPPALRADLEAAATGTRGVLMREAQRRFEGARTRIAYRYRVEETEPDSE